MWVVHVFQVLGLAQLTCEMCMCLAQSGVEGKGV